MIVFAVCFALGLVDAVVSVAMIFRVNERLPEGHKLAWWRRDNYWGRVNRAYREQFPDSILPDLESYLTYTMIALIVVLVLVSFYKGRIG